MAKPTVAGKGGDAKVTGSGSSAVGGDAGDTVEDGGGDGGDATVTGNNSKAYGGPGGRGGLGRGQDGGHAHAKGDNMVVAGGEGGEANQRDGRGGRGGRSGFEIFRDRHLDASGGLAGLRARLLQTAGAGLSPSGGLDSLAHHLDEHLGIDITQYGRGGDGANSIQYEARLAIVSAHIGINLTRYASSANVRDLAAMTQFIERVNEFLQSEGHQWKISVVAECFAFMDL